ncbi:MAG TPA: MerC domain-containing protein, partial [Candidatus Melainabacteria bacterium]|nr:MerC domain-containing protein [Candidatus Melainabacteria bacterium]
MKHLLIQERWKDFIDVLSIIAPIICLFDCIVLPAMAILLPFVSVKQMMHGISDQMIALVVLGICMTAILPGFLRHRSRRVLVLFGSGISLLFFV